MATATGTMLTALLGTLWLGAAASAAPAADAESMYLYQVRIADQRPPCSGPVAGMPITPNDPGAITTAGGQRRCYGTRPAELELWLPAGRFAWLTTHERSPAAWIAVGPVLVDPSMVELPPLGIRVTVATEPVAGIATGSGADLALETRYGPAATLTPIAPGRWQQVDSADGHSFWVFVTRTAARDS